MCWMVSLQVLADFLFCLNSCAGFVEQAKGLEMDAISSAVIGGTLLSGGVGTPIGTLFGVLIKGTISSLITTQGTLSSWWVRIILSTVAVFLHCDSVSDCFYEEESEISDDVKQAEARKSFGLFFVSYVYHFILLQLRIMMVCLILGEFYSIL